eukprot:4143653-Prymnesium_polylepis.1
MTPPTPLLTRRMRRGQWACSKGTTGGERLDRSVCLGCGHGCGTALSGRGTRTVPRPEMSGTETHYSEF